MTSLSERLTKASPTVRRPMSEEPVALLRAAASIAQTWPHIEVEPTEEDPEQLVAELERRCRSRDWSKFSWSDLDRASRALINSGLWRDSENQRLLEFLCKQVRPGVNRPYLRTLFRKYLETFDPESRLTRTLAPVLKAHWRETALPVEPLVTRFRIFDLDPSPSLVIAGFMVGQDDPFAALRGLGVEVPHAPGLMAAAHAFFVSSLAPRIAKGESAATRRLLSWLKPEGEDGPLHDVGAAQAIDVLLEPWQGQSPDSELQHLIEARLLAAYGDPRIHSTGVWARISPSARRVILRWLAGATIEVFFDIVTRAVMGDPSEYMWKIRRELWKELFDEARISEAWFALSEAGVRVADRLQHEHGETPLEFARNRSQSSQDRRKCLLIMNVEGRWVVEGSHLFPTWVFPPDDLSVLTPYETSYTCEQFRYIHGPEKPERIPHSPTTWRNKVLTALKR